MEDGPHLQLVLDRRDERLASILTAMQLVLDTARRAGFDGSWYEKTADLVVLLGVELLEPVPDLAIIGLGGRHSDQRCFGDDTSAARYVMSGEEAKAVLGCDARLEEGVLI